MLSGANKRKLRSYGHQLSAHIQIGKGGITDNLIETIDTDLEAHELIKVTMLKTCDLDLREAAILCAAQTGSEVVQMIGRTFLLYRANKENRYGIRS